MGLAPSDDRCPGSSARGACRSLRSRAESRAALSPSYLEESPDEIAAVERAYIEENPHPPTIEALLGHLHADSTHDALDRLHLIKAPTLITSGEMDWEIPTRYGRAVQERIEGSRMHVFSGPRSSHLAFVEIAEEFNQVSRAFLDEHAGLASQT